MKAWFASWIVAAGLFAPAASAQDGYSLADFRRIFDQNHARVLESGDGPSVDYLLYCTFQFGEAAWGRREEILEPERYLEYLELVLDVLPDSRHERLWVRFELAKTLLILGRLSPALDELHGLESKLAQFPLAEPGFDVESRYHGNLHVLVPAWRGRLTLRLGLWDQSWYALDQAQKAWQVLESLHGPQQPRFNARFNVYALRARLEYALPREGGVGPVLDDYRTDEVILAADAGDRLDHLEACAALQLASLEGDAVLLEEARANLKKLLHAGLAKGQALTSAAFLAGDALGAGDWSAARVALAQAQAAVRRPSDVVAVQGLRACLAARTGQGLDEAAEAWARTRQEVVLQQWFLSAPDLHGLGIMNFTGRRDFLSAGIELGLARGRPAEELLLDLVELQAYTSLSRSLGAEPTDLAEIRATLLPEGSACLVFQTSFLGGHVFLLDQHDVVHARLPRTVAYRGDRLRAREVLQSIPAASASAEEFHGVFTRLGKQLLPASIAGRLGQYRDLLLVGADLLPGLRFEALRVNGASLGCTHTLSMLPSLPAAVALVKRPGSGAKQPVGLLAAPLGGAGGRPALPIDRGAARRVVSDWGAKQVTVHHGSEADREAFEACFGTVRVGQLLTHGIEDLSKDKPQGFELTGSAIWPGDVHGLGLPDLVLATFCGGGRGPYRMGDGGAGPLAEAFLRGGSRSVVVSESDLLLAPTVEYSREVHRALAVGSTPAEALRRARCALAESPRWAHPAFWANPTLVGIGHLPLPGPQLRGRRTHASWIGAVVLALAVGAAARWWSSRGART